MRALTCQSGAWLRSPSILRLYYTVLYAILYCTMLFSKFCALFPLNNFYNCAVFDFSILGHVTRHMIHNSGQRSKFGLPSQLLSLGQCFQNLVLYSFSTVSASLLQSYSIASLANRSRQQVVQERINQCF